MLVVFKPSVENIISKIYEYIRVKKCSKLQWSKLDSRRPSTF